MTTIEVKKEEIELTEEQKQEFTNGRGDMPTQPKQEGDVA